MATTFLLLLLAQSGTPVITPDAVLATPVAGLERTSAKSEVVPVAGRTFGRALRVTIGAASTETNETQLTLPNAAAVRKGDTMLASLWARGGRAELLFERATDPWTKSVSAPIPPHAGWRRIEVPFRTAESYAPGEAMLSLRLAFGPQTVEVGGVDLRDLGPDVPLDSLVAGIAARDPIGDVTVAFDLAHPRQTMLGLGGNFAGPRYGKTESPDAVGRAVLASLPVRHARVGLPLDHWEPSPGEFHEEGPAAASMRALAELSKRGVPTVVSIWEGPQWMLPGGRERSGRVLSPAMVGPCTDAIVAYLKRARDGYGARADYLSFNEPDGGINFRFTPDTLRDFIRQAGPRLAAAGLRTRFVVGDTAGGSAFAAFAGPIADDPTLAPYLGPLSFHCWDVLSAPDESYRAIAALGARTRRPVWCLEAGHDSALWEKPNPWPTWDNALRTALAYERTLSLARPSVMDYWTYEDDYPIASKDGKPYPVLTILKEMEAVFAPGGRVVAPRGEAGELPALGTVGPKGRVALLLVNARGAGRATLTGLPPSRPVRIETSDAAAGRTARARTDARGRLAVPLPTRSVVTAFVE